LPVDQDGELAIVAPDHIDVGLQFPTDPRRHPDGVQAGDSVRAVANRNSSHLRSPAGEAYRN
jgi:hypothetical protein